MADFDNQLTHESYTHNDQLESMDSDYRGSLPLNQTAIMDSSNVNAGSMNSDGIYSYNPSQALYFANTDYNNAHLGVNESLNTEYYYYGYAENNENRVNDDATMGYDLNNYNSPSIHNAPPPTSTQTPWYT